MPEYGNMDKAVSGLAYGSIIDNEVRSFLCADVDGIPFGGAVFSYIGEEEKIYSFKKDVAKIVYSTDFVADNSTVVTVGDDVSDPVLFDTNHSTTMDNLAAAVSLIEGIKAIPDPADGSYRTLLIQRRGSNLEVDGVDSVTTGGAGQPTVTITYDSGQVFIGVALFSQKSPGGYEKEDSVSVLVHGQVWVEVADEVWTNRSAFIEDTAGVDFGKFSSAGIEVNAGYRSNASLGSHVVLEVLGRTNLPYSSVF